MRLWNSYFIRVVTFITLISSFPSYELFTEPESVYKGWTILGFVIFYVPSCILILLIAYVIDLVRYFRNRKNPNKSKRKLSGKLVLLDLLIFFAFICIILFLVIVKPIIDDNPSNWSPFFSFYRTSDCVILDNTFVNSCYLLGVRSNSYSPEDYKQNTISTIKYLNIVEESTQSGFPRKELNVNDWSCRFSKTKQPVNMQTYLPKKGDTFDCWPNKPLDPAIELQRSK